MANLQITWFFLVGILLTGYAVLDGFDLGAGFWHLLLRTDDQRRQVLNAIGPVWDGNKVWLVTGGGALFAAFPMVYASVFSGLYLAFMLFIVAMIFRAVAIEFRSQLASTTWRRIWDLSFGISSLVAALLLGVALGNVMRGLPVDRASNIDMPFFSLLNPYALLVGLLGLITFVVHGGLYLTMKIDEESTNRIYNLLRGLSWSVPALFFLTGVITFISQPQLIANYRDLPVLYLAPLLVLVASLLSSARLSARSFGQSFFSSALAIVGMMATAGLAIFPELVPALPGSHAPLTIYDSSSTERTLTIMLLLTLLWLPVVVGYTIFCYRQFRGKVEINKAVY